MVRRKGEITPRIIRRRFGWFCELPVPPNGFGERYEEMVTWCGSTFGHDGFGKTSRHENQERGMPIDYVQFRFRTEDDARAFRSAFGGTVGQDEDERRRR